MEKILIFVFILSFAIAGCETVKKGTTAAGTVVGKGADAIGGVTEGAAEGYGGSGSEENPYNR